MLVANFLPPISFLFTRAAFDALGGVYEAIPYLGDWDFLVRFVSKYEVFMIPQYLAFYHWRTRTDSAWMGNTVTDEIDRHQFYRQLLLNQWLRADLAAGRFGVGVYANLRNHIETLIHQGEEQRGGRAPAAAAPAPVEPRARPAVPPPPAPPAPEHIEPASVPETLAMPEPAPAPEPVAAFAGEPHTEAAPPPAGVTATAAEAPLRPVAGFAGPLGLVRRLLGRAGA